MIDLRIGRCPVRCRRSNLDARSCLTEIIGEGDRARGQVGHIVDLRDEGIAAGDRQLLPLPTVEGEVELLAHQARLERFGVGASRSNRAGDVRIPLITGGHIGEVDRIGATTEVVQLGVGVPGTRGVHVAENRQAGPSRRVDNTDGDVFVRVKTRHVRRLERRGELGERRAVASREQVHGGVVRCCLPRRDGNLVVTLVVIGDHTRLTGPDTARESNEPRVVVVVGLDTAVQLERGGGAATERSGRHGLVAPRDVQGVGGKRRLDVVRSGSPFEVDLQCVTGGPDKVPHRTTGQVLAQADGRHLQVRLPGCIRPVRLLRGSRAEVGVVRQGDADAGLGTRVVQGVRGRPGQLLARHRRAAHGVGGLHVVGGRGARRRSVGVAPLGVGERVGVHVDRGGLAELDQGAVDVAVRLGVRALDHDLADQRLGGREVRVGNDVFLVVVLVQAFLQDVVVAVDGEDVRVDSQGILQLLRELQRRARALRVRADVEAVVDEVRRRARDGRVDGRLHDVVGDRRSADGHREVDGELGAVDLELHRVAGNGQRVRQSGRALDLGGKGDLGAAVELTSAIQRCDDLVAGPNNTGDQSRCGNGRRGRTNDLRNLNTWTSERCHEWAP